MIRVGDIYMIDDPRAAKGLSIVMIKDFAPMINGKIGALVTDGEGEFILGPVNFSDPEISAMKLGENDEDI